MKIITNSPQEELSVGDLIAFNGYTYLVVAQQSRKELMLINLGLGCVYSHEPFQHPLHIINHVKKHYGKEYTIIKGNKVELHINP